MPEPEPVSPATDAKNRSWRTWLQGLAVAVFAGIGTAVKGLVDGGVENVDPNVAKWSVANAAAMAAVSYVWRRWLDPSRIPSARPPGDA